MTEIGRVPGLNNQVASAGISKNGKVLGAPAQPRSTGSAATPRQVSLPMEDAVREVARSVADYIVSNRLTRDEGYQAFRAEFFSEIPLVRFSDGEMEFVEKLSQTLLDSLVMSPLNISTSELSPSAIFQAVERLMAVHMSDASLPISDRISEALAGASTPPEAGPQQMGVSASPASFGEGSNSSNLLRVDLKEILGGKSAELRIRYDAALIVSKVAVLLEQMNGLVRMYEALARGASRSRQKFSFTVNPSLRQVLVSALGFVVDGNKAFGSPASIGVLVGRDGLFTLDSTLLKSALEAHRDEAAAILKSLANTFYDNIGLYVDPRLLARSGELPGSDETGKRDRSRKESERRWKRDKERLEKRFLELTLILEESGKLRDWFMEVVEPFGCGDSDGEPLDEVTKRALPAVELPWDQEGFLTIDCSEELKENVITLFIACTTRALLEEDADACIKLLLKRRIFSDKLLAERPDLESKIAMACLANEEFLLGKMEAERKKLFENLDGLSRTMVAARGYRSQFPFPPPMATFIASKG